MITGSEYLQGVRSLFAGHMLWLLKVITKVVLLREILVKINSPKT